MAVIMSIKQYNSCRGGGGGGGNACHGIINKYIINNLTKQS